MKAFRVTGGNVSPHWHLTMDGEKSMCGRFHIDQTKQDQRPDQPVLDVNTLEEVEGRLGTTCGRCEQLRKLKQSSNNDDEEAESG